MIDLFSPPTREEIKQRYNDRWLKCQHNWTYNWREVNDPHTDYQICTKCGLGVKEREYEANIRSFCASIPVRD